MNSVEAANMVALIKAINGNKEAVAAIDDGGVPSWWRSRLAEGTANFWIPILEAFAKDGAVEIQQIHVKDSWRVRHVADFNHDPVAYRPVRKPLFAWAVVRDTEIIGWSATPLDEVPGCRVIKLTEEVGK